MGKRAEKMTAGFGDQAKLFYYANLGVTAACLFDYFVLGHQWSLLTLAISVLIINGFALWQSRHNVDDALRGDAEEEAAEAQSEASRDAKPREGTSIISKNGSEAEGKIGWQMLCTC